MARLQILELPTGADDDRPPFVLVIDQAPRNGLASNALRLDLADNDIATRTGARAVLVFEDTIDIPANDTSGYLRNDVTVHVGDQPIAWSQADGAQAQVAEALKPRRDWCCSLAFQTLGKQHIDDCRQGGTQP